MLTYHKHKEMIIRWKVGAWSLFRKCFLMTEVAFRTIFERCNRNCALLYFTAAIPRTQEACRNAGFSPIPRLFQHCRYQRHKMILRGRSVYHNVETMVKHFAHFARGTSVLESPATEIFCLPKWAMSLLNSKSFILMNFSGFLLKPCFGALWKSFFFIFFSC